MAIVAIGLGALRANRTHGPAVSFWRRCAILALALIGALCRRGEKRAWWAGFAAFGWVYMGCAFATYDGWPKLPTQVIFDELMAQRYGELARFGLTIVGRFFHLWHCLSTLLAAVFGGLLARILFATTATTMTENSPGPKAAGRGHLDRWMGLFVLYLCGLLLLLFVFFGGEGATTWNLGRIDVSLDLVAARAFRPSGVLRPRQRTRFLAGSHSRGDRFLAGVLRAFRQRTRGRSVPRWSCSTIFAHGSHRS